MSDTTLAVTPGTGALMAVDNIGGTLFPRSKLVHGASGTNGGDVATNNGLPVQIDQTTPGTTNGVQVNAALPAGTNIIGAVTPPGTVHLTAAPTVTAGAYSAGYVVGGVISFSGAARINSGSGTIQSVIVNVKTALTAPYDVFFFDTNPSNGTYTDNSAYAENTSDSPYCVGVAHCNDLVSCGTPQRLQAMNCAIPFKLSAAATTLYAIIVMRGAETLATSSAIGLSVIIVQD